MAWESRCGRGRYYTRSVKRAGRVVREYVGAGPKGEQAADEDARRRAEQDAQRAAWRAERARLDADDASLWAISSMVDEQTQIALAAAGFHQHARGAWRRRRGRHHDQ